MEADRWCTERAPQQPHRLPRLLRPRERHDRRDDRPPSAPARGRDDAGSAPRDDLVGRMRSGPYISLFGGGPDEIRPLHLSSTGPVGDRPPTSPSGGGPDISGPYIWGSPVRAGHV